MPDHSPVDASARMAWVRAAFLAGIAYLVIGRVFALPTSHVRAWRLAAWLVSGIVYAAHITYEQLRLREPIRRGALHVAVGVAIGAFALAVAAMLHSLVTTSAIRPAWLLALVLWPAFTGVPAFLGALLAGAVLARLPRRADGG